MITQNVYMYDLNKHTYSVIPQKEWNNFEHLLKTLEILNENVLTYGVIYFIKK